MTKYLTSNCKGTMEKERFRSNIMIVTIFVAISAVVVVLRNDVVDAWATRTSGPVATTTINMNSYHHHHASISHYGHGPSSTVLQVTASTASTNSRTSEEKVTSNVSVLDNADFESTTSIFPDDDISSDDNSNKITIVLVAGFERFNRELYQEAIKKTTFNDKGNNVEIIVFSDSDIRIMKSSLLVDHDKNDATTNPWIINPTFAKTMRRANVFIGSLLFDYDDVMAVQQLLQQMPNTYPKFIFESATELMSYNQVGTFSMMSTNNNDDGSSGTVTKPGPPPFVKAILSKFGSNKEEDKLAGYLQLLKIGPDILKYVPGNTAQDLRTWMSVYRYWNQGGTQNIQSMFQLILQEYRRLVIPPKSATTSIVSPSIVPQEQQPLPDLVITPDIGLVHPLVWKYNIPNVIPNTFFSSSPAEYLRWRLLPSTKDFAKQHNYMLAPDTAPRVAVLLFRKHVITGLKYIPDLLTIMEQQGIIPIPIFINGVEAHTIVRDLLTSEYEIGQVGRYKVQRDNTYQRSKAVTVDAIVNTIGFPLVGGPAGSMEAGRNVAVASQLLSSMNVPYVIASPLLLQTIPQWQSNGVLGLQSVVLYSLPELDGAIDTVVIGGLVGDKIALVPERVRKLTSRINGWVKLRRTPTKDRSIAICLYGFPPNVGAVGTAALLNVPKSLDRLLRKLHDEGYDTGSYTSDPTANGESIVAALTILCENSVIKSGADRIQDAVQNKIRRAMDGDVTVPSTLGQPGGGLGGAYVRSKNVSPDELEQYVGKYMMKQIRRYWSERSIGEQPGVTAKGEYLVSGLQIGNIWVFVQPLLGVEGDPMRLLFERNLTPHPQYAATYALLRQPKSLGGIGAHAIVHLGMHGTVEWLPGQPLGNDRKSWSDELLGDLPNLYIYAANNPSESILAKRRGYGTLVSYNVPPYGRAGLYLSLSNLKELVDEYRINYRKDDIDLSLCQSIYDTARTSGMLNDVPFYRNPSDKASVVTDTDVPEDLISGDVFDDWIQNLSNYLNLLQDRLFSSGLRILGSEPTDAELNSYLEAYFGDRLSEEHRKKVIINLRQKSSETQAGRSIFDEILTLITNLFLQSDTQDNTASEEAIVMNEAKAIATLLHQSTEELTSVLKGLDGGYIKPAPGGDLLRDGPSVLPTGRNIHALDPYRMPSASAWVRGQIAASEIIRQHQESNGGKFPETVAVTLWGLDAIKTRGESVAIVLALIGAKPVKEGTGRIVRYDLIPLEELGRPRIDVLASLSGIFRDSFANIVDLLDDMFERCADADEPLSMNFVKKHASELKDSGVTERTAARLFSNPPGDYGSMVNELVGTGDWEDSSSLGETWRGRNVFSYGRNEGGINSSGTARPAVLDKLLATTERIVQEIDSVEYGLSDIQEYYANTGALKTAAENRKEIDPSTGKKKKVSVSIIEAFGGGTNNGSTTESVPVRDLEDVLRLEYRSKLLNPKWRDAMLQQGSGGAYEISQRMTAMIGWAATSDAIDNFVFDQVSDRYTTDEGIIEQLQKSNPEAYKNILRRLLEAAGRGMWETDEVNLERLRDLYSDADDRIEEGSN